jgi:hypothetical protein
MDPGARWLAAWAVAYNVCHHLGALPGGLGSAGGGTRWVDWLDLLTPYAVVGLALAALAAGGTDRRGWVLAGAGALTGWGWSRRDEGTGRLLLVAFGLSTALLAAYGGWHGGFPAPSSL